MIFVATDLGEAERVGEAARGIDGQHRDPLVSSRRFEGHRRAGGGLADAPRPDRDQDARRLEHVAQAVNGR